MSNIILCVPTTTPESQIAILREIADAVGIKLVVADMPEQHDPFQLTTMDFVIPETHYEPLHNQPKKAQKFPHHKSLKTFQTMHAQKKFFYRTIHK